jgi:hypothetical protein
MKINKKSLRKIIREAIYEAYIDDKGNLKGFSLDNNDDDEDDSVEQAINKAMKDMKTSISKIGQHPDIAKKYGNKDIVNGDIIKLIINSIIEENNNSGNIQSEDEDFNYEAIKDNVNWFFEESDTEGTLFNPEDAFEIIMSTLDILATGVKDTSQIPDPEGILKYIISNYS